MTKNPFEIRSDILAMAKDMLDKQYDAQMKLAQQAYDMQKDNMEKAVEAWNKALPTMYTPQEVMEKAKELYTFVSDKK